MLGDAILQTLAARAGRSAPLLAPATRTRLASHAWPGDVFELEAVLGRALAAVEDDLLEPPDLGLDPDTLPPPPIVPDGPLEIAGPSDPPPDAPRDAAPAPVEIVRDARLELLLAELAHEILNPLSTVKMLLGHLPQLLADAEAREALSGRADDAIGRVDTLLQNVLDSIAMIHERGIWLEVLTLAPGMELPLEVGDAPACTGVDALSHETQPPPRFSAPP